MMHTRRGGRVWSRQVVGVILATSTVALGVTLPVALAARLADFPDAPVLPGRIVYTRASGKPAAEGVDIFVAEANGDGEIQITTTDDQKLRGSMKGEDWPRWSPDGEEIAFTTTDGSQKVAIWRVAATGGTPTPMVTNEGGPGEPAWHPITGCIVYCGARVEAGSSTLDLKTVCPDEQIATLIDSGDLDEGSPEYSPDGSRLVYEARSAPRDESDEPDWRLMVADADGAGASELLAETGTSLRYPRWSPNGRRIAFIAGSAYGVGEIRILEMDSHATSRLADVAAGPFAWSPDGKSIIFYGAYRYGPQIIPSTPIAEHLAAEEQLRGLYLLTVDERGLYRLRGAAGGADAGTMSYEWGYSPDWWAPSPLSSATPTAGATATASVPPTDTTATSTAAATSVGPATPTTAATEVSLSSVCLPLAVRGAPVGDG